MVRKMVIDEQQNATSCYKMDRAIDVICCHFGIRTRYELVDLFIKGWGESRDEGSQKIEKHSSAKTHMVNRETDLFH